MSGLSRRQLLAAAASTWLPGPRAENRIPFSLIIDDGAPIDPMYYEHPGYPTRLLVPPAFTRKVADSFHRHGLRGKFTVIPMPGCLGRIDQSLKRVPSAHLAAFLKEVRERIAPRFDITPEFLTHSRAWDLKRNRYMHIYEDVWISQAPPEEITDYFVLAFQILRNVGLEATGITSPWTSGADVEKKYARAVGDAQWRVFQRRLTFYFLHSTGWGKPRQCSVECEIPERPQAVVSVPANCADIFWPDETAARGEQRRKIQEGMDRLLSPDGRTGRIRELAEAGYPVVLLTHWQSLFYLGSGLGLEGLDALAERIRRVFGARAEWLTCSELARRSAPSTYAAG